MTGEFGFAFLLLGYVCEGADEAAIFLEAPDRGPEPKLALRPDDVKEIIAGSVEILAGPHTPVLGEHREERLATVRTVCG